jgi:hypothetical protein
MGVAIDTGFAMLKQDEWDIGDWENIPLYSQLPDLVQGVIRSLSPRNIPITGHDFDENPGVHEYVEWWNGGGSGKEMVIDKVKEELLERWNDSQQYLTHNSEKREAAGFTEDQRDEWYAHAYDITNEGSVGGHTTQVIACPNCGNTHLMRSRGLSTRFHTRPATEIGQKREGYYRQNPGKETAYCPSCRTEVKGEWQERLTDDGFSNLMPQRWPDVANPAGIPSQQRMALQDDPDLHNTNPIISNLIARIHQYEVEEEKRMEEGLMNGTVTFAEYNDWLDNRVNAESGALRDRTPQEKAVEVGVEAMRKPQPELLEEEPEPEPEPEIDEARRVYEDMEWNDWRRDAR